MITAALGFVFASVSNRKIPVIRQGFRAEKSSPRDGGNQGKNRLENDAGANQIQAVDHVTVSNWLAIRKGGKREERTL